MSIQLAPGSPCTLVHLADSEIHFRTADEAQTWAFGEVGVHAIEPAQTPCWTAYCDNPACEAPEGDEDGNATHVPGNTQAEAEERLQELKRTPTGALLCEPCRAGHPPVTADHG